MKQLASNELKRVCEQVWREREAILSRRGGLTGEAALVRAVYWRLCKAWGGSGGSDDGSQSGQTLFNYQRMVSIMLTQNAGPHYDGSILLNELVRRYRNEAIEAPDRPLEPEARTG